MGLLDRLRPSPGSTGLHLQFAAVDVETTGLDPAEDRIIELAVVLFDPHGRILHEWTTLVSPGTRTAGAVAVHGIQDDWLAAAPTFREVAGDLVDRLVGRVIVVHNARFDLEFIEAEFRRLGLAVRSGVVAADTMDLAEQLGLPRRLPLLASSLGIPYYPHSALDDARATAQIMTHFMPTIQPSTFANRPQLQLGQWPGVPATGKAVYRQQAAELTRPRSILSDAVNNLPPLSLAGVKNSEAAAAYLTLLEQVMEDGYVSPEERRSLLALAQKWGMGRAEVDSLHREFLDGLLDAAVADRKLSKSERQELQRAAIWLGVEAGDLDLLIRQGRARARARFDAVREEARGQVVAFTGRGIYSNSIREGLCLKYGIVFKTSLSPNSTLLVVGSPSVENATLAKARQLGVPIMVESAFWERLGETIPRSTYDVGR